MKTMKEGKQSMDILDAIFTRRSIRKFTGEQISEDNLKLILKAGFYAPSAHNHQPWHFVVIRNDSLLERIANTHPYAKMLPQAGCGIVVCGDLEKEERPGFLVEDCSASIENILLAAHGIGLGAVWCGLYPVSELTEAVIDALDLPTGIIPVGLVAVGSKNEDKEDINRYNKSRIHYEQW